MPFKVAAMLATLVLTSCAQDMPNILYVIERLGEKNVTEQVGGEYRKLNGSCNGQPLWFRVDREHAGPGTPTYIYLDNYWYIGTKPTCIGGNGGGQVFRSLVPGAATSFSSPHKQDWNRKIYTRWILDKNVRVRNYGCQHPKGCLQLNCQEPEKEHTCSDCSIDGAVLDCSSGTNTREIVLGVVAGLICLGIVAFLCYLFYKFGPSYPFYTSHDVAKAGYKVGVALGRHHEIVFAVVIGVAVLLTVTGLPLARLREHGSYSSDWAPEGGRLERELKFVDKWTESSKTAARFYVMVGPKDGSNAFSPEMALELLRVYQEIYKVKVEARREDGSTVDIGFHELCASFDSPSFKVADFTKLPCIAPSILDCFFEGGWLFDDVSNGKFPPPQNYSETHQNYRIMVELLERGNITDSFVFYDDLPALYNMAQDEFARHINSREYCEHWIKPSSRAYSYLLGSMATDPSGRVTYAKKLIGHGLTFPADRALDYKVQLKGLTEREVDDKIELWYDEVNALLERMDAESDTTEITVYMTQSPKKLFERIAGARAVQIIIGIAVVYAVAILSQLRWGKNKEKSMVRAAVIGTTMVLLSNLSGYGVVGLLGIELNHAMLQALPFVALGLGVDDMFLLMHYYRLIDPRVSVEEAIGQLFREGGMSVTMTSVCNAVAFFAGTVFDVPALRDFLLAAGVMVVLNYLVMVYAFPAVLAVEHKLRLKRMEENPELAEEEKEEEEEEEEGPKCCPPSVDHCYVPFIKRKPTMIFHTFAFFANIIVAIVALNTFAPLDFGSSMTDLTPRGSYLSRGFEDIEEHLLTQRMEHWIAMTGDAIDWRTREGQMLGSQFEDLISNNEWTSDNAFNANSKYFLHTLYRFLADAKIDALVNVTATGPWTPGKPFKVEKGELLYVPNEEFYKYYHMWRNPSEYPMFSIASQTADGFGHKFGADSFEVDNRIEYAWFAYSLDRSKLKSTDDWLRHIDDLHDMADRSLGEGAAFPLPSSEYVTYMEFRSLRSTFWVAVGVSISIIFAVCLLFAMSLRGALIVAATSCAGMLETAAMAMFMGLDFSSLVAVTLLMSIGMFVEFSAHVVIAHETHPGTREQRQELAVRRTFLPVLEGGVSSVLSFVLLAFSEFPYVFKYFFLIFFLVILVGLNHGLLLLPGVLGVLGHGNDPSNDPAAHEPINEPPSSEGSKETPIEVTPESPDSTPKECLDHTPDDEGPPEASDKKND